MSASLIEVVVALVAAGVIEHFGRRGLANRTILLAVISTVMLATWQWSAVVVTLSLALFVGLVIELIKGRKKPTRKLLLRLGVGTLVAVLVVGKYLPWLAAYVHVHLGWAAPLGLSFTTFRLIGILVDAEVLGETPGALDLWLVSVFYPAFRAGPITSCHSLERVEAPLKKRFSDSIGRLAGGLFRKFVLCELIHSLVIWPWINGQGVRNLSPVQCLLLPIAYSLYVYLDFSGYCDIGIATARIMGIQLPENFAAPYVSRNLMEFWKRWHITLSEWIRTRVFMKLAGRRAPKWRAYVAMIVAMALCGIWHGAGWGFLLWGVWHGVGIVAAQSFGQVVRFDPTNRPKWMSSMVNIASVTVTFSFVALGWLFFFLPAREAIHVVRGALGCGLPVWVGFATALVLSLGVYRALNAGEWRWTASVLGNPVIRGIGYAAAIFALMLSASSGADSFVYFRF